MMNFVEGQRVRVKLEELKDADKCKVPNPCFGHISRISESEVMVEIFKPISEYIAMSFELPWKKPFLEAVD